MSKAFDKMFKQMNWVKPNTIIIYPKLKSFEEFFKEDLTKEKDKV